MNHTMDHTGCPVSQLSAAFDALDLTNPFPILKEARAEEPIFYNADIDYWVITRYADIKAIFRDHETFTAANTITPIARTYTHSETGQQTLSTPPNASF